MGGLTFRTHATSRIPAETLTALFLHLHTLLSPYYAITMPPTAPGKTSHGDIDLLVLPHDTPLPEHALSQILSAAASAHTNGSSTTSFAVPFPPAFTPEPAALFQLDIHVCATLEELEWKVFQHSYGDFWIILGSLARWAGLKIDDKGLHLRAGDVQSPELLFLTRDPSMVLRFLGLDENEFRKGTWCDLHSMFEFAKTCRFFSAEAFAPQNASKRDRRSVAQRPGWKLWLEQVLSDGFGGAMTSREEITRLKEEVRMEAVELFGKGQEYEVMVSELMRAENDRERWKAIREWLPLETAKEKGLTARALKIRWDQENSGMLLEEWVEMNWLEEWGKAVQRAEMQSMLKCRIRHNATAMPGVPTT